MKFQADIAIVGCGPAGAFLALQLLKRGYSVHLLEQGDKDPGFHMQFLHHFFDSLVAGVGAGGSTGQYYATWYAPDSEMLERFAELLQLNPSLLIESLQEVKRLLPVHLLEEKYLTDSAKRIMDAARKKGLDWKPLEKMLRTEKYALGRDNWNLRFTSAEWLNECQSYEKFTVQFNAFVENVVHENGRQTRLLFTLNGKKCQLEADKIILSAGGIGTPAILQRTGIVAGKGFFCDPLIVVSGQSEQFFLQNNFPMLAGVHLKEGIMITDIHLNIERFLMLSGAALRPMEFLRYAKTYSIMVKIKDSIGGIIDSDASTYRNFGNEDRALLKQGEEIAKGILESIGAKDIWVSPITAAHPGGSARLGETVNGNFETEIAGLFVCDASIIPFPFGIPPTATVLMLANTFIKALDRVEKN